VVANFERWFNPDNDLHGDGNFPAWLTYFYGFKYENNADGTAVTRLTNDPARDLGPAWSSDGARIIFQSSRSGTYQLYVMSSNGTNIQPLTEGPSNAWSPDWSPVDNQVVFCIENNIYIMQADGSSPVQLTDTEAMDMAPVWSPDGSKIAFMSNRDDQMEVYVMDADGSHQTRLTFGSNSP